MRKRLLSFLLAAICYLGCHNGYLALYDENNSQPILVLPYKTDSYSETDRAALSEGIPCRDLTALTRLLEDFLS